MDDELTENNFFDDSPPKMIGEGENFAQWAKEFKETIEKERPNAPLVAQVSTSSDRRTYGPFMNADEAIDWIKYQPLGVKIHFYPLRTPYRFRTVDDFYNPHTAEVDAEYDHTAQQYPEKIDV